jgi:hypothetical protein
MGKRDGLSNCGAFRLANVELVRDNVVRHFGSDLVNRWRLEDLIKRTRTKMAIEMLRNGLRGLKVENQHDERPNCVHKY